MHAAAAMLHAQYVRGCCSSVLRPTHSRHIPVDLGPRASVRPRRQCVAERQQPDLFERVRHLGEGGRDSCGPAIEPCEGEHSYSSTPKSLITLRETGNRKSMAWNVRHTAMSRGLGSPLATSAPGLGTPLPHLLRDWAHPCHICAGAGHTHYELCTCWSIKRGMHTAATRAEPALRDQPV